jgi:hypothetical protein
MSPGNKPLQCIQSQIFNKPTNFLNSLWFSRSTATGVYQIYFTIIMLIIFQFSVVFSKFRIHQRTRTNGVFKWFQFRRKNFDSSLINSRVFQIDLVERPCKSTAIRYEIIKFSLKIL